MPTATQKKMKTNTNCEKMRIPSGTNSWTDEGEDQNCDQIQTQVNMGFKTYTQTGNRYKPFFAIRNGYLIIMNSHLLQLTHGSGPVSDP